MTMPLENEFAGSTLQEGNPQGEDRSPRNSPRRGPPPSANGGAAESVSNTDTSVFQSIDSFGGGSNYPSSFADATHKFFYPRRRQSRPSIDPTAAPSAAPHESTTAVSPTATNLEANNDTNENNNDEDDAAFVKHFWRTYDDIIILAIFTQIGILFRLASSTWFTYFSTVFTSDSPLFVNLPLNALSCFLMGLLCGGDRLLEIVMTRFSPPRLQQDIYNDDTNEQHPSSPRRRQQQDARDRNNQYFHSWQPPVHVNEELRNVQLLALERRIRASKCLVLFPVRKEDVDVVEDYYFHPDSNNTNTNNNNDFAMDLQLQESHDDEQKEPARVVSTQPARETSQLAVQIQDTNSDAAVNNEGRTSRPIHAAPSLERNAPQSQETNVAATPSHEDPAPSAVQEDSQYDFDQIMLDVQTSVQENVSRFNRVNLVDGWDQGTTADDMSDDLMLGLRDGFCGALSSFSSWNSAMVTMLKHGKVGDALVGYMLGIQLPIIAYRFGQHVAVYIFIWRCRRETRQDARRGYGIRISQDDSSVDLEDNEGEEEQSGSVEVGPDGKPKEESALPSVRAVATAIFIMALVTQCTSLSFYSKPASQMIALSLLFSPLGVFARWRLSKLNGWRPSCPLGTFTANMLACALSGSFGSLLAGDPGPRERVVLQSIIAGFGGTLSSVAAFITEVLAGVDPILFRFDGIFYAFASVGCAMVIAFVTSGSVDWVDNTTETVHAMSNSTLRSGLNGTGPMNGINNGTRFY